MAEFYCIITDTSLRKLANAKVSESNIALSKMAVGDGNGTYYEPKPTQTELVNEKYRFDINRVYIDNINPKQLLIEASVSEMIGGFFIREIGVFDEQGDLFAIGKYPVTYKPTSESGSGKDLYIRMALTFSNTPNISLYVNPHSAVASIDAVENMLKNAKHNAIIDTQGGDANNKFHLTQEQHTMVADIEALKKELNSGKCIVLNDDGTSFEVKSLPTGLHLFSIFQMMTAKTPAGAYPLWTGEYIRNCKNLHSDFWDKAIEYAEDGFIRIITEEKYEQELSEFSETGAFVLDEESGDLRLPKITRLVSSIEDVSEIGLPVNDQMQGHKHSYEMKYSTGGTTSGGDSKNLGIATYNTKNIVSDDINGEPRVGSETRGKSVKAAQFIQVYNTAASISMAKTAELIEATRMKADVSLSNILLTAALSNLGLTGGDGYVSITVKHPDNSIKHLLIQWGRVYVKNDGTAGVVFPKEFLEECLYANWMQNAAYSTNGSGTMTINSLTKTEMIICNGQDTAGDALWIAIGY